jgi:type I restriction enzyme S subunit
VDEAIESTQAVIDQLQVVKKAMMADLLTRGIPGRHKKFKQTEIGEVPAEWDVVELDHLCSDIVDCPHATPVYTVDGYVVVRTADVIPGRILLSQAKRTSEEVYRLRIRRLAPLPGDVFYSREGERFGIAAPVPANEKVCLGQRMMHFRASPQTDPGYLCWLLNSSLVYGQAVGGVGGSTSPHVNVGDIKRFRVPRPSQQEQQEIGRLFAEIESRTEAEELFLQGLNGVKSALMSVLLTGEVRVRVDEESVA